VVVVDAGEADVGFVGRAEGEVVDAVRLVKRPSLQLLPPSML
jgi:hypothetical protein